MLAYHHPDKPVGAWNALTVKLDGLHVAGKLLIDDVPLAREVRALVQAGAVKGLSIGFSTKRAITRKGGGRTITALDLAEISLVTIPLHRGARVTARSLKTSKPRSRRKLSRPFCGKAAKRSARTR
jgi:HK97 family phage prohead protease